MARKFNQYLIQISFPNKEVENIEYSTNNKTADKTSYKQMLLVYKDTKELYSDVNCVIDFLGINEHEMISIFKKYNQVEEVESQETNNEETLIELFDLLKSTSTKIESRKDFIHSKLSELDIQISYINHTDIEISDNNSEQHKIKTFDKLKQLMEDRRDLKLEHRISSSILNSTIYTDLFKQLDTVNKSIKAIQQKSIESGNVVKQYVNEGSKELTINGTKYYKYSNFSDRMNLMKQLSPIYNNIIHDEDNSQLICRHKDIVNSPNKSKLSTEEKEVSKLIMSKGGSVKYKTFESRDIYLELLNEKFSTVFDDCVKMKITCGNMKKGVV